MRIIARFAGKVDVETNEAGTFEDGVFIRRILVGDNRIIWGIASIFEQYQGKLVCLTIEELPADTEIIDTTAIEFRVEKRKSWIDRIAGRLRKR